MSMTQEFDPRNWREQRRERLARIAAAAVQPPWPVNEKCGTVAPPIAPEPVPEPVLAPPRAYEPWFVIEGEVDAAPITFTPQIMEVQLTVSRFYGVSRLDVVSQRRTANLVRPRQVAMYLAKTMTGRSLPEIGRRFGGRDHTTVLHAVRKIGALIEKDAGICSEVTTLKQILDGIALEKAS